MPALLARARAGLRLAAAGRALAAVSLPFAWYALSADPLALKLALVSISLMMVAERIAATLPMLLLHALLIAAGIAAVSASRAAPVCYVAVCALMAYGSAAVMQLGLGWKTLGTFTWVPSLYLGSELRLGAAGSAWHYLSLLPLGLLPVALVVLLWQLGLQWQAYSGATTAIGARLGRSVRGAWLASCRLAPLWPPTSVPAGTSALARRMAWARALGGGVAALWVVARRPEFGEWVVWSTASVVAGDWLDCQSRCCDRVLGLVLGLPLGALAAYQLPANALVLGAAVLGTCLSLASFNTYRYAYLVRCAMLVLGSGGALMLDSVARWRAENVAVGCAVGMLMAFFVGGGRAADAEGAA